MTVWLTGDTHNAAYNRTRLGLAHDMSKLGSHRWPIGKTLTAQDVLIICGDTFGVDPLNERYWLDWLSNRPWTTLFVEGNHDNHAVLAGLPSVDRFGGQVGQLADHVFHLRRGHVYVVDGLKVLAFGGARSVDKDQRFHGQNWWPEEEPTQREVYDAFDRLAEHGNQVDFVVTHAAPGSQLAQVDIQEHADAKLRDSTCDALQTFWDELTFRHWYCGHYHIDQDLDQISFLYQRVLQVTD